MNNIDRLTIWLDSIKYVPPNQREKDRMKNAIEFDLENLTKYAGVSKEHRMETFEALGYLIY